MLKKVSDFLNGIPMTIVSGIFLVASLALLITKNFIELNISPYLDFAWVTIVISGFPLIYLAISRLIMKRWVSSALLITVAMIASICVGEVFAAGEVAFIMAIGSILEDKTVERAKKGLNNLIKLSPQTGRVLYEENGKILEKIVGIDEIESGMKKTNGKYEVVVDRIEAIKTAINMAGKTDIIVLAGKGHEPYQEINGVKYPFDERKIVNDIIG